MSATQIKELKAPSVRRYSPSNETNVTISDRALGIFCGVAVAMSLVSGASAWWMAREFKLIQVQLMYTNALLIRGGLVQPGDMVFGPEGNLLFDGTKFKPEKPKEK